MRATIVLAVVTSPLGLLLVHRRERIPAVMLPGARPEPGEQPRATAERGALDDARVRVRAGRALARTSSDGRTTVYVSARPLADVTDDAVVMSLHVGWYLLDQVAMVLPDLPADVLAHLERTVPRR